MRIKPGIYVILIGLSSCFSKDRSDRIVCRSDDYLLTRILRNGVDISDSFIHAYGIGHEAKKIFPSRVFIYDTLHGAYADTLLLLPLDVNRDTSRFCLIKKDLSMDTVSLAYKRTFEVNYPCDYYFKADLLTFPEIYSGFYRDSSYIDESNVYSRMLILIHR